MGATSQTPQLAVDLGTAPSDTLVWSPSGLDIVIDLDICFSKLEAIQSSPTSIEEIQGDCHRELDFCKHLARHVDEPWLLHRSCELQYDEWDASSAGQSGEEKGESGPTSNTTSKNCENTAQVSAEKCGASDTDCENTVKAQSEVGNTDHDDYEGDSASTFWSKGGTNGNGSDGDTPIPVAASTVYGIEGLDVDDISAACQLLELGLEDLEEEDNRTSAASRLFELSVCCSREEAVEDEGEREGEFEPFCDEWDDQHDQDRSGSSSADSLLAPGDPFCTDLALYGEKSEHCQENCDPWSALDIIVDIPSDLRTLKLKRIKPNKLEGSTYRGSDENDEDLDVLDRPPHKRQYKSLRQLEATM